MLAAVSPKAELIFETVSSSGGSISSVLYCLDADVVSLLAGLQGPASILASMLRVCVASMAYDGIELPDLAGHHELVTDGIRFTPMMPLQGGLLYRAWFNLQLAGLSEKWASGQVDFRPPARVARALPEVIHVYPSSDVLPVNLLRFYISFSRPMQRGRCEQQIVLRDAQGEPVLDALYRAPIELWDGSMRHLTILLDPGRLKHSLGPNVALGPPMRAGEEYELEVGQGMIDVDGQSLRGGYRKRFRTAAAVRLPVEIGDWVLTLPCAGSFDPITFAFPRPLDWALLFGSITVETADGMQVDGRIKVTNSEMGAEFFPASQWCADRYMIKVTTSLEDPCGNDLIAAFDRPYRQSKKPISDTPFRVIQVTIAPPLH